MMRAGGLIGVLVIAAASMAQAPRLEILGPAVGVGFGHALAVVDDLDGDGIADLAVSAPREPAGRAFGPGTVRIFSGADGQQIHLLRNEDRDCACAFGAWIGGLDDVDGDGVADVLVGSSARGQRACPGAVFAFSGGTGALLRRTRATSFGARLQAGLVRVGDLDGDGHRDVLAAGLRTRPSARGDAGVGAWILGGRDGRVILELATSGVPRSASFGRALTGIGDANGDGVPDVALGDVGDLFGIAPAAGAVHVFSGFDGARLATWSGGAAGDDFGASLAWVRGAPSTGGPEPSGDARGALLVGAAQTFAAGEGYAARLGFDGDRKVLPTRDGGRQVGRGVASVGDLDGDGRGELLVVSGASACSQVGSVRVLDGADGATRAELCAPPSWCDFGAAVVAFEEERGVFAVSGSGPADHPTGAVLVFALDLDTP